MTVPSFRREGEHPRGVPGTEQITRRIADAFSTLKDNHPARRRVDTLLSNISSAGSVARSWPDLYQEACAAAQAVDNSILDRTIREAVLESTTNPEALKQELDVERSAALKESVGNATAPHRPGFAVRIGHTTNSVIDWVVRPGLLALADIIRRHPSRKGAHIIVTTNFDPLISVALNRVGARHVRIVTDSDYPTEMVDSPLPIVNHVHGYWLGPGRMLNLKDELDADVRKALKLSLYNQFFERTIIVAGYGGWDDVVMEALADALAQNAKVIWLSRESGNSFQVKCQRLSDRLRAGSREFFMVEGVDADSFLESIAESFDDSTDQSDAVLENTKLRKEAELLSWELAEKIDHRITLAKIGNQLDEIRRHIIRMDEANSAQHEKVSDALASIRTSAEYFSTTTVQFKSEFAEHRGNQGRRLKTIESQTSNSLEKQIELASAFSTLANHGTRLGMAQILVYGTVVVLLLTLLMLLVVHI